MIRLTVYTVKPHVQFDSEGGEGTRNISEQGFTFLRGVEHSQGPIFSALNKCSHIQYTALSFSNTPNILFKGLGCSYLTSALQSYHSRSSCPHGSWAPPWALRRSLIPRGASARCAPDLPCCCVQVSHSLSPVSAPWLKVPPRGLEWEDVLPDRGCSAAEQRAGATGSASARPGHCDLDIWVGSKIFHRYPGNEGKGNVRNSLI
jgi:hypothetical protein